MISYFAIGVLFFAISISVIYRNIHYKVYEAFLWFCDLAPFLLSIAFIIHNDQFIKGIISIGLISQFFSLIGLSSAIFFKKDFVGFVHVLKKDRFYQAIEYLIHLFSVIFAFLLVYAIKPEPISLAYSFWILIFLYFPPLLFTKEKYNINYVYQTNFLGFTLPYHRYLWIPITFVTVVLPTYAFQYLLYLFFH